MVEARMETLFHLLEADLLVSPGVRQDCIRGYIALVIETSEFKCFGIQEPHGVRRAVKWTEAKRRE